MIIVYAYSTIIMACLVAQPSLSAGFSEVFCSMKTNRRITASYTTATHIYVMQYIQPSFIAHFMRCQFLRDNYEILDVSASLY
jgi:hypothetical protein